MQYGAGSSFPTTAFSASIGGGANFFAGGEEDASSTATQSIDVSGAAAEIDAGGVAATLTGQLGGWESQEDNMVVGAVFLNGSGATLGQMSIGPVTQADRAGETGMQARSTTATVPAGTCTISVVQTATRSSGAYNDGYADNLNLTLASAAPAIVTPSPQIVTTTPTSLAGNLVKNPGAEASAGADTASQALKPTGWETDICQPVPFGNGAIACQQGVVTFTAVKYGASGSGFPDATAGSQIGGGNNFFAGGEPVSPTDTTIAWQFIDLGGSVGRGIRATWSADLGGSSNDPDLGLAIASFEDASVMSTGTAQLVTPTPAERGDQTKLVPKTKTRTIGPSTRYISVQLQAYMKQAAYDDAYFDNVSLVLSPVFTIGGPKSFPKGTALKQGIPITVDVGAGDSTVIATLDDENPTESVTFKAGAVREFPSAVPSPVRGFSSGPRTAARFVLSELSKVLDKGTPKLASASRHRAVVVGRVVKRHARAGKLKLRVKLTKKAARAFRPLRRVKLTLAVKVTTRRGSHATRKRTITLKG